MHISRLILIVLFSTTVFIPFVHAKKSKKKSSLFASGQTTLKGRKVKFKSAVATWNKKSARLDVMAFPFKLTKEEEKEILNGDKNDILHWNKIRERPFSDKDFFLWLMIFFKSDSDIYNDATIQKLSSRHNMVPFI